MRDGGWFVFGEYADGQHVDIADGENLTLLAHVPRVLAEELIEKHNQATERLRGALRNVLLLTLRDRNAWKPENAEALIRFCREAGIEPRVLR